MSTPRRKFLHLATGAVALSAISSRARAQAYPTRPVRIIVGFPAGGPTDIVARVIAQRLSERLGQELLVKNRPGAASNIGTEAALRAPPDGYTLLQVTSSNAVNATFYKSSTRSHERHRAGRGHRPRAVCNGDQPIGSSQERSPNSSLTPRPTRARSIWRLAASEPRPISPASSSR